MRETAAMPTATIPRIRILLIPRPVAIQAQPAVESNEQNARKPPVRAWQSNPRRQLALLDLAIAPGSGLTVLIYRFPPRYRRR
jgi:hypothetical protein